ncbi:RICIN domain-containing protein (plasmid) [Streptomyces scopuliridis]|uniref:RICIN domain-containing protein n=1 Tax=Streptomyces scopuliridis TaxID=452529 RepID=UPI002DD7FC70|nr:RICIN domain-containing protein [Streptomyces scopuliridis]WSB39229.1 RICIN domain-containing protein [Streptomyces scopuliridis]
MAATAAADHHDVVVVSRSGDDPPGDRFKKPLLAAASIAGALLIAVPLLVAGQNEREPDRTPPKNVAGPVLDTERSALPDTRTSESPPPQVKPSKEEKDDEEEEKKKQQNYKKPPSASTVTPFIAGKLEPRETPKEVKKKPPTPTARELANALSHRVNVQLRSVETRKCADLPYFGKGKVDGPVRQYDCRPTTKDNQLWDLKVVDENGGPGGASLFVIKNRQDGLCVDLPYYGAAAHGTKISQYHCNGTSADNQRWWLDPHPGGYWLRNVLNNRCMAVDGGRAAGDDARLKVTDCGDTAQSAQRWSIVSVV